MAYNKTTLNGIWQLQPGNKKPDVFKYGVPVPAMVDNCEPKLEWQNYNYFWYKTQFYLKDDAQKQNVYLQMEQVQFGAEVWLNNNKIGFDIPCYTSQWFDLTPFINNNDTNILLVRVGQKSTLPPHSAVGNDQERLAWLPGIWGDVYLHQFGFGRIKYVQIIPDIDKGEINVTCELENFEKGNINCLLNWQVTEKKSGKIITVQFHDEISAISGEFSQTRQFKLENFNLWSPENPFLYELQLSLSDSGREESHTVKIPFGMRRFEIRNGQFFLNNKRHVLMGSNIAFHRLLNDSTRKTLLWDETWIKKVFIDIPKEHNLTFFRFHLGHAYNRWYDMADEYGIMLEDEWGFWTSSGTPEQTELEFTAWIKENYNRPGIVIWNALNESNDKTITGEIIPKMKKLDPTRPWQHVDFHEDHPYIYSLGPVLNNKKFGFTRSIFDLQKSESPTMVNEFEWWWLDRDNNPSELTQIVVERWLGRSPTKEMLIHHQAFLAAELGELWRRLDLDAIMPFVYLSVGEGATANWFDGLLENLNPKPVLAAYKNAFSPLGISIELWDRHFVCGEKRIINVYLFNDSRQTKEGVLRIFNKNHPDKEFFEYPFSLAEGKREIVEFTWNIPEKAGSFLLRAEIESADKNLIAFSEKQVHLIDIPVKPDLSPFVVADQSNEIIEFLNQKKIPIKPLDDSITDIKIVFINQKATGFINKKLEDRLSYFVNNGGTLIIQEPEFGIENEKHFRILNDLKIKIAPQDDHEMGGYNSYIFPENDSHSLWKGIEPEHLKMFNGALGGEIVSAHDVIPNRDFITHARCGLSLAVPAVMEIPYGKGRVIISRIQIRGRLNNTQNKGGLYDRRYDPVAEQYFWNLITH